MLPLLPTRSPIRRRARCRAPARAAPARGFWRPDADPGAARRHRCRSRQGARAGRGRPARAAPLRVHPELATSAISRPSSIADAASISHPCARRCACRHIPIRAALIDARADCAGGRRGALVSGRAARRRRAARAGPSPCSALRVCAVCVPRSRSPRSEMAISPPACAPRAADGGRGPRWSAGIMSARESSEGSCIRG